jgi:hypothetical protein
MSFLSKSRGRLTLYEGQFSFIIMGMHLHWWTALCLSDNYYENPKHSVDTVEGFGNEQSYTALRNHPYAHWIDPAVLGEPGIEQTSQDPLMYFTLVCRCRVARHHEILKHVVDEMKDGIRVLQNSQGDALGKFFEGAHREFFDTVESTFTASQDFTAKDVTARVGTLKEVCRQLQQTLGASINEYKGFLSKFGRLFAHDDYSAFWQEIATSFEGYGRLMRQLEGILAHCDALLNQVSVVTAFLCMVSISIGVMLTPWAVSSKTRESNISRN